MRTPLMLLSACSICMAIALTPSDATAQFLDPAFHNLETLEPLILGSEDNSFHMEPKEYRLKVGQGYRWPIRAETEFEYGVVAPQLFRNIRIRKVEIGDVEVKAARLEEIEFEDVAEAELFFVAVRPGTFEFGVRDMHERGMVGTFIVE